MTRRRWTDEQLRKAVTESKSYRAVLIKLGLVPAGGNYQQIKHRIDKLSLNIEHFLGKGWNVGLKFKPMVAVPLSELLISGSSVQSYKLKQKLFGEGIFLPRCQLCNWAECSPDGRIPVELDHINGDRKDNRLENLRILCPNCHSLQLTHRGKNMRRRDLPG